MTELDAMRRALDLAWRGWGRVHPNPLVGAVVLSGSAIIGEGYHAEFGGPHAEREALAAAGGAAREGTLVVTLEPCAHHGQQPPCVDAVIAAGISRVVAAMPDPHPLAGGGAERLRAHGIAVEMGLLRDRAERQNAIFLHSLVDPLIRRPFVAVKLATSLDHRIADAQGHSRWISGEEARDFVQWLRAGFDAIGVGARSAMVDNPALTVRGSVQPRVPPRRVIFQGARRLPLEAEVYRSAREIPTLVVSGDLSANEAAALAERGVEPVRAPTLTAGLAALWERGLRSILIEGGGRLTGALLQDGLVDRYYWIVSPLWLGDHGTAATRGHEVASLVAAERWTPVQHRALGQDTLLVYDRR